MDWGSRCLRGLVARELSSDDSDNKWKKKNPSKSMFREFKQVWGKGSRSDSCLTSAALLSLLCSHLHEGVQNQGIVQPGVPVLQLLQEVSSRGLRHFPSGQLTQPLNEARDVQQGYYWRKSQFTDPSSQWHTIHYTVSLTNEDNLPWLTSAREGLALRFCWAFLAKRVCLSSFPTSGSEMVTDRMRQKLASCCWSKLWTRPDRLGIPSNWIIS